jgi:hypothetical protein
MVDFSVKQSRHFRVICEENIRYRSLLKNYTSHQLYKLDDFLKSVDMFKEIILPRYDDDYRLKNIRDTSPDTQKDPINKNHNNNSYGNIFF